MRTAAAAIVLLGLAASPVAADQRVRYGERGQGIPPGHLPPAGECRVWYDGRPPGQQPPPTSCREAERVAARDPYARVIYGSTDNRRDGRWRNRDRDRDDGWWRRRDDRDEDRRGRERAIPRRYPSGGDAYPDRYPRGRGGYEYGSVPFDNGNKDGYDKGREDARDHDSYDPVRHSRYRSADRGYDRRYGTKDQYKYEYREGFETGYERGYRDVNVDRGDGRRSRSRFPWPF